jgi:hypothetical protein
MKRVLMIVAAAVLAAGGAASQERTMQPIPNPPVKARPMMKRHAKHHHMARRAETDEAPQAHQVDDPTVDQDAPKTTKTPTKPH